MAHPDAYCMSADVAGPIRTPGRDPESRNHKPATFKYFLSVSYRFPRLKGVKEESDPAKTEGFPGRGRTILPTTPLSHGPWKGDPGAEECEDYRDPLYSPSVSEVEEEQEEEEEEDGKRVTSGKGEGRVPVGNHAL